MCEYRHTREAELVQHYDGHAEYYSPGPTIMPAIIDMFEVDMNLVRRVLDLGCGDGRVSLWLAGKYDVRVDGVDYSQERVSKASKLASEKGLSCRFWCRDLNYFMEEPRGEYDLVLLFEVLEHLEEPARVVDGCRKLLRPNGTMLGSVPLRMPHVAHLQVYRDVGDVQARLQPARVWLVDRALPHVHAFCEWKASQ